MPIFGNRKQSSRIIDHRGVKPVLSSGVPDHPKDWLVKREEHYAKYLGLLSDQVLHDTTGKLPHIDIYTIPADRRKQRDFTTLVTSGMSDLVQPLPDDISKKDAGRVELVWYVEKPEMWMYGFLLGLAKLPFSFNTFLFYPHTIENGFPNPDPGSPFRHIIILPAFFEEDGFHKELKLDGIRVRFLWPIPISRLEMDFKREKNWDALLDLMEQKNFPRVYIPDREPLVQP